MPDNTTGAHRWTRLDPVRDDEAPTPPPPRTSVAPRDPAQIPELPDTQSDLLARATRSGAHRTEVHFRGVGATVGLADHYEANQARLDTFKAQWTYDYRLPSGRFVEVIAPFRMNSKHAASL
jgi:hypothetical protein